MPHKPKTVVNVTLQGDEWDYDERVTLGGQRFRLVRVGTSGDAAAAEEQVSHWSQDANAIAVSGLREARAAGHFSGRIEDLQQMPAPGELRRGGEARDPAAEDGDHDQISWK